MGKFIDMTGWVMKDHGVPNSRLTVVEKYGVGNSGSILWRCECECGNDNVVLTSNRIKDKNRPTLSCGCLQKERAGENSFVDMTGWVMSEHGIPDSKLVILKYLGEGNWLCRCSCGNDRTWSAGGWEIRTGRTKSCGCLQKERARQIGKENIKGNEYDLESEEYGIGFSSNTKEQFYFDKEYIDKLQTRTWRVDVISKGGYKKLVSRIPDTGGKDESMAQFLFGQFYDHLNGNTLDNRKQNLVPSNPQDNAINRGNLPSNSTGLSGVKWRKDTSIWEATITSKYQHYHLGCYTSKEDAIVARLNAEIGLGVPRPRHKDLYEKYNIDINGFISEEYYINQIKGRRYDEFGVKIHHSGKPVVQCTKDDIVITCYKSGNDAERRTGICEVVISACCSKKKYNKSAGGYHWFFVYDHTQKDGTLIPGAITLGLITEEKALNQLNTQQND